VTETQFMIVDIHV